jgi:hypothetical protein
MRMLFTGGILILPVFLRARKSLSILCIVRVYVKYALYDISTYADICLEGGSGVTG